jgi:hypothetical protein
MTIHERDRADNADIGRASVDIGRASADVDRASVRASGAARCISKAIQMQRVRMRNERARTERVVPRTPQATGITGSLAILVDSGHASIACQATAGIAPDRLPPTVCGLHCLPDCLPDCLQSTSASAASREKLL